MCLFLWNTKFFHHFRLLKSFKWNNQRRKKDFLVEAVLRSHISILLHFKGSHVKKVVNHWSETIHISDIFNCLKYSFSFEVSATCQQRGDSQTYCLCCDEYVPSENMHLPQAFRKKQKTKVLLVIYGSGCNVEKISLSCSTMWQKKTKSGGSFPCFLSDMLRKASITEWLCMAQC